MKYFINGKEVSENEVKRLLGESLSFSHCLNKPYILKASRQNNCIYITKI